MEAVVLDLFGTLVAAPTPRERSHAADRLATVVAVSPATVERYFRETWQPRHDGTLPTVSDLATHLVQALNRANTAVGPIIEEFRALAHARLVPPRSVVSTLETLRTDGLRLGALSDASAEIATTWTNTPLSMLVDAAVFSCEAGGVKPDQRLYTRIQDELNVPARRTLYVGDGGGDELRGALRSGMKAVAVGRRGPSDTLACGARTWPGPFLDAVEEIPAYLAELQ